MDFKMTMNMGLTLESYNASQLKDGED